MNTIRGDKSLWEKLNATKCDISIGTILNDTKGAIRIRISKDRQDNDQKKKDRQDNDQKKKDRQDNDQKKKDRQDNDQKKKEKQRSTKHCIEN